MGGENSKFQSLEGRAKKRARRRSIENAILATLTVAGTLTVAMAAPKVLTLLKYVDPSWIPPRDPRQRLNETAYRMKKKGLIGFRPGKSGKYQMVLTEKGRREMSRLTSGAVRIKTPLRWDGRWRIIIFDIPEKQRAVRDRVRSMATTLGLLRLQDSVWVHPYDCEEIVALLKTEMRLGRKLLYIIADAIEHDLPMREHFRLPQGR